MLPAELLNVIHTGKLPDGVGEKDKSQAGHQWSFEKQIDGHLVYINKENHLKTVNCMPLTCHCWVSFLRSYLGIARIMCLRADLA